MMNKAKKITVQIPNANSILKDRCLNNAIALYGDPIPAFVQERMKTELHAIIENNFSSHYVLASNLAMYSKKKGYPVTSSGMAGSLIVYLSGISEINPLSPHYRCPNCRHVGIDAESKHSYIFSGSDHLPDKVCPVCGANMIADGFNILPEINMGLNLDREPVINMNFAPELRKELVEYIKSSGKNSVFRIRRKVILPNGTVIKKTLPGRILIIPSNLEIPELSPLRSYDIDDELQLPVIDEDNFNLNAKLAKYDFPALEELSLIHDLGVETGVSYTSIPLNDPEVIKEICRNMSHLSSRYNFVQKKAIQLIEPNTFTDIARIKGLMRGTNTWHSNAKDLIQQGIHLNHLICSRDDIMRVLLTVGFSKEKAFSMMKRILSGEGLTDNMVNEMTVKGVSAWYIQSASKIKYLISYAECLESAKIDYFLAYYSLYFPEIYSRVFGC